MKGKKQLSVVRLTVNETALLLQRGHLPPHRRKTFVNTLQEHYPECSWDKIIKLEALHFRKHQYNEPAYLALLSMLLSEVPRVDPNRLKEYIANEGWLSEEKETTETQQEDEDLLIFQKQQLDSVQSYLHEHGQDQEQGDQRNQLAGTKRPFQKDLEEQLICPMCPGTHFEIVERQNRAADETGAQSYICCSCGAQVEIQK